jgi:hypothetical protein
MQEIDPVQSFPVEVFKYQNDYDPILREIKRNLEARGQ